MAEFKRCNQCYSDKPAAEFIGARGRPVKGCSRCRETQRAYHARKKAEEITAGRRAHKADPGLYALMASRITYYPDTGDMTWTASRCNGRPAGSRVGATARNGYRYTAANVDGVRKTMLLHRLAYYMTHGVIPDVVDHIDFDRANNRSDNLRSGTYSANARHRSG